MILVYVCDVALCIDLDNKQFVKQGCIKYSYGVNMHTFHFVLVQLDWASKKYNLHMNFLSAIVFFYNTFRIRIFPACRSHISFLATGCFYRLYQNNTNDEVAVFFVFLLLMGLESDAMCCIWSEFIFGDASVHNKVAKNHDRTGCVKKLNMFTGGFSVDRMQIG